MASVVCSVCSDEFCDPRVLSCGHTFCLKCIEDVTPVDSTLKCPQCSQVHAGFTTATAIPRNIIANDLIEALKRSRSSAANESVRFSTLSSYQLGILDCQKECVQRYRAALIDKLAVDLESATDHFLANHCIYLDQATSLKSYAKTARSDALLNMLMQVDTGWDELLRYLRNSNHNELANQLDAEAKSATKFKFSISSAPLDTLYNSVSSGTLETVSPSIPHPNDICLTPIEYIGAGANGFVLKVSDESNNNYALKIVPVIVKSQDEKSSRVERETRFYQHLAAAKIIPNLARAVAWWNIDNMEKSVYLKWSKSLRRRLNSKAQIYSNQVVKEALGEFKLCVHFVQMKYYASGNLKNWLEVNSDECKETYLLRINLYCDILNAVDFLHARDLMHRDICPNNIFLAENSLGLYAVLGDFDSIVSCGEQALWPLTKARETFTSVMGTDPYAAPEIYGGDYDKQCDLFSLGVLALNFFFNTLDYNGLRYALHKIRESNESNVFPRCVVADDGSLWLDIVKAQLSGNPQLRMSSYTLLKNLTAKLNVSKTNCKDQSLYLLEFYSNELIKLKDFQSGWVKLSPILEPKRIDFNVTACAGKLYVIGGEQLAGGKWMPTSLVQQYDVQTGWQDWFPMLQQRVWCGGASLDGLLFAVGGADGDHRSLSSVEQCNIETGHWTFIASMADARLSMGVAVFSNLLFALGGRGSRSLLNSVECYDPRAGIWTKAASMHDPRTSFSCAALGDRLYVAGGWTADSKGTALVECFDLRAAKWTRIQDMCVPRLGFKLAALNGQLLAAGGHRNDIQWLQTVEVYDERRDSWTMLDVMVPCQHDFVGCVLEL